MIIILFLQNFPIIHPLATIMESFFITSIHVHQKTSDFAIVSHNKLGQLDLPTSNESPSSRPWCIICRRVLAKRKIPAASVLLTQSPEGVKRAKCQSVAWQSWIHWRWNTHFFFSAFPKSKMPTGQKIYSLSKLSHILHEFYPSSGEYLSLPSCIYICIYGTWWDKPRSSPSERVRVGKSSRWTVFQQAMSRVCHGMDGT